MTKDVIVSISGLQFGNDMENDKIEIITSGNYYKKNNKHYVLYEEITEGFEGVTKNIVKFDERVFNLTKSGITNVNMVFEKDKRSITNYITPYGNILVGIDANKIDVRESNEKIQINIDYALDVNYEHLADCKIHMDITAKNEGAFSLH
ncbi:MAG TPA: DUF1934 domain-containing protein [Lachnospiraceae bacterium]|nr:DUF1934 domain-containing protein [Lachnospiraceae bacterium]